MATWVKQCTLLFLALWGALLFGNGEEEAVRRVQAHLVIGEPEGAVTEAKSALALYPESPLITAAYVRALAEAGREKEMLALYKEKRELLSSPYVERRVLEHMGWGVVRRAFQSRSAFLRVQALIGSVMGGDVPGVDLLLEGLRAPQANLRGVAVELAAMLRDDRLKDEVRRIFNEEKRWDIRLAAMKSLGQMQIRDLRPHLEAVVASDTTTAEEKATASEALLAMMARVELPEVEKLARSDRSGLRMLACLLVGHIALEEGIPFVIDCAEDESAEVRGAALQTLGLLLPLTDSEEVAHLARRYTGDSQPEVALTAAWLLTLCDPVAGRSAFRPWFQRDEVEWRALAAAALANTGERGWPLGKALLATAQDPWLRLNLAVGFLPFYSEESALAAEISEQLSRQKGRMAQIHSGVFEVIVPLEETRAGGVFSPEEVDQLTRLELTNLLAVAGREEATTAFLHFLQEEKWNISSLAQTLLLTEGDEEAITCVKELLEHPDKRIRLQAALIVAIWGREESVLSQLQGAYGEADRATKERILEALGKIGDYSSVPFLVERLGDAHQSIRVMAAASLLSCLQK